MTDMGLSIVNSAIQADQAEMATVADNLANVSTPGFARESVSLSTYPSTGPGGVQVTGIGQLTSGLLDAAQRGATAQDSFAKTAQSTMSSIQALFPEPSSSGLGAQLSQMWSDFSTLAANPSSASAATVVISDAKTVAATLNDAYNGLSQVSSSLTAQLGTGTGTGVIAQANTYLADVASLNRRIVAGQVAGANTNALVDQRRADLSQLAGMIGATSRLGSSGSVTVYSQGVELVQGSASSPLVAGGGARGAALGISTAAGVAVSAGGTAGAILAAVNSTLPSYRQQLSAVANALASGVDAAVGSTPPLFVSAGGTSFTPSSSSAGTIAVGSVTAAALVTAASSTGTYDGVNAANAAALASASGGPDATYRLLIGNVGSAAAAANQQAQSAQGFSAQASSAASSVSGVDTNSQAVKMLQAQQAFQAAAKVAASIAASFQTLLQAV